MRAIPTVPIARSSWPAADLDLSKSLSAINAFFTSIRSTTIHQWLTPADVARFSFYRA